MNILILYHSQLGSVQKMARLIARGVESVADCNAVLRTVPEVRINDAVNDFAENGDPYVDLDDLKKCDGLVLGSPTRFGNMSAPLQHFIEKTSGIWFSGELVGKPAGVFTSSSSMHGGQESTLLSMHKPLIHQGMVLCGIPYTESALSKTTTGGTPYGASHVAGNNNQNPISDDEKSLCIALGKRVATMAKQLAT